MQFHRNQLRKYVLTNHLVMTYIPQNEFHGEMHKKKKKGNNQNNFLFWKKHWSWNQESWLWLALLFSGSVTLSERPNFSEYQRPSL